MQEAKKTKELHIGEYNSIMDIFRYSPVTYCKQCGAKKYGGFCKCDKLPVKIGNAKLIDSEFLKFKRKLMREEYGSREEPKRREDKRQHNKARHRKRE